MLSIYIPYLHIPPRACNLLCIHSFSHVDTYPHTFSCWKSFSGTSWNIMDCLSSKINRFGDLHLRNETMRSLCMIYGLQWQIVSFSTVQWSINLTKSNLWIQLCPTCPHTFTDERLWSLIWPLSAWTSTQARQSRGSRRRPSLDWQ